MTQKIFKQIVTAILACLTIGAGIGMSIKVGIGADALSAFYVGIAKHTNITVGTVTALMNLILCVVAFLIYKKNVGIATVLFIFLSKWPIDFATNVMITSDNLLIAILFYVISITILALGAELFIFSGLGATAYDALTMSIGKFFKHEIKYIYIRWGCDAVCLLLAFLLGGDIGIGTIISWILMGTLMKMWQNVLEKFFLNLFTIET